MMFLVLHPLLHHVSSHHLLCLHLILHHHLLDVAVDGTHTCPASNLRQVHGPHNMSHEKLNLTCEDREEVNH